MIKIRGLHKWFGTAHVLRGIDLHVEEGETLVIIGRSGCGKSVLLKHIIGILEPDEGEVIVNGNNYFQLNMREQNALKLKLGMLFQGAALFDSLNVLENVGFSLFEHTNTPYAEVEEKVRVTLAKVGLRGIEELMPASLSGGMKKRVGLARAICNEPAVILYDEPTTGLDPINADVINDLILQLKKDLSVTSVVVTHDMKSAYKIADRIAMLYDGKIIGTGGVEDFKNPTDPVIKQFISGSAHGPITQNEPDFQ